MTKDHVPFELEILFTRCRLSIHKITRKPLNEKKEIIVFAILMIILTDVLVLWFMIPILKANIEY